jgi:thiosulfate reductase cytochrome b subunit
VVTGILFSDISFLRTYVLLWNLAGVTNALHLVGAYVFVLYLIVHLYMATLGRTPIAHTKAMFTGFAEEAEGPAEGSASPKDALPSPEPQKE